MIGLMRKRMIFIESMKKTMTIIDLMEEKITSMMRPKISGAVTEYDSRTDSRFLLRYLEALTQAYKRRSLLTIVQIDDEQRPRPTTPQPNDHAS